MNEIVIFDGVKATVSLPQHYDRLRPYPVIFLNDGELDYLNSLSQSVILVGLTSKNRLDDYTPWKAEALLSGGPGFGGLADDYHQALCSIAAEIKKHYLLDTERIAYGGYSLGGLAAVYSLYGSCEISCVFSLCGSFWYPGFTDYCRKHEIKNRDCLIYLQNGKAEGANHSNRLSKAPFYAEQVHCLIQKEVPNTCSVFDPYGHHDALKNRYAAFASWLRTHWQL